MSVRGGPGGGCVPWVRPARPLTAAPRAAGGPRPRRGAAAGCPAGYFVRCPAPATSWRPQAGAGRRACPGRGAGRLRGGDMGSVSRFSVPGCSASFWVRPPRLNEHKLNSRPDPAASSRSQYLPSFLLLLSFLLRPARLGWDGCGSSLCACGGSHEARARLFKSLQLGASGGAAVAVLVFVKKEVICFEVNEDKIKCSLNNKKRYFWLLAS